MARKRYARRRRSAASRSRRRFRRRAMRRSRSIAPRPVNMGYLLPDRVRVKMPYFSGKIAISGGVVEERVFSGSDIRDPDVTGIGHYPMLFAEYMALYYRFYVAGSKFKATLFVSGSGAYSNAGEMVLLKNTGSSLVTSSHTRTEVMEQRGAKTRVFGGTGSTGPCSIVGYGSTKRILSAPGRTSYDASGTSSLSPNDLWYWHFVMYSPDETTSLAGYYDIKVVYYVEFSDINWQEGT